MNLVILNALAYITALIIYWRKQRKIDCGFAIFAFYAFVATCGVFEYIVEPERWNLTTWSFIYLFVANMILFRPLFVKSDSLERKVMSNQDINLNGLKIFCAIYIILSILTILFYLPLAIDNIKSGAWAIVRNATYEDEFTLFDTAFARITSNLSMHFTIAAIVVYFYFLTQPAVSKLLKTILLIAIVAPVLAIALVIAARSYIFTLVFTLLTGFLFFRNYIPRRTKRGLLIFASILMFVMVLFTVAVTIARFGADSNSSLLYYFGHSMLTFSYGVTDTISSYLNGGYLFNRFFDVLPSNFDWTIGTHFETSFFTFVGSIYVDFGAGWTIMFISLIALSVYRFISKSRLDLADIFIYLFYVFTILKGALSTEPDLGWRCLISLLIYIMLKIMGNKHTTGAA